MRRAAGLWDRGVIWQTLSLALASESSPSSIPGSGLSLSLHFWVILDYGCWHRGLCSSLCGCKIELLGVLSVFCAVEMRKWGDGLASRGH